MLRQKHWQPLQAGDVVQIIAPASKSAQPEEDCKKIQRLLKHWKLKPLICKAIFADMPDFPDLANTDEQRFADLRNAILNPSVKAIWCLRGGYGAIRLLPWLQNSFRTKPPVKLFIGYSDVTILHHYFQQRWGWCTVHAAGASQVADNRVHEADILALRQLMFGQNTGIIIRDLIPLNAAACHPRKVHSVLTGGNLTLITRTLGTPYAISMKNKIVVLEDTNEPFRKVDGMLQQLDLAGYWTFLQKPAAIILGDFTINAPAEQAAVNTSLQQLAQQLDMYNIPVLRCLNIGHGAGNHPLPFATKTTLTFGEKPVLIAHSGAKKSKEIEQ